MEVAMPTFLCFLNWTDQGAKNAKDANKRFQASKGVAQKLGGKLVSAYVTTGQYDVVLTLDMPNGEAMAKFASAISGSGNARTTTVRGYTPDEFSNLLPKPRSSNAEILSCRLLIRESSSLRHCIQSKHGMFDSDNAERIISG